MNNNYKAVVHFARHTIAAFLLLGSESGLAYAASPSLTLQEANRLAAMPLHCAQVEYPNKLNQVLADASQLQGPKVLHPAFYGCFDWHSSVHGHWMMVTLLRHFPDLENSDALRTLLKSNLTAEHIRQEVSYFHLPHNSSYERTYGWAWLLKLAEELHEWDDPLARELEANLQPLTALMVEKYSAFLPKLIYPIRTGEHPNTAFALSMAFDYASAVGNETFASLLSERAIHWYGEDKQCPLSWEPNGFDFLSPCFEEADIMRKVLDKRAFLSWMDDFMPQLSAKTFTLDTAKVSDRTDGKLVHLDGLNFSRAWSMYGLANSYPTQYGHLHQLADEHVVHSLPAIVDDNYEGTHWLGSFAVYALQHKDN